MDTVTQQNAALVEQAAAAADSVREQAATLAQLVSVFQLDNAPERRAPAQPRSGTRAARPAHAVPGRLRLPLSSPA